MNEINQEQLEAHAVDILKTYTPDVYAGPDITAACMDKLLEPDDESLIYMEPTTDNDRRVLVAKLDTFGQVKDISRELIPLCYVIGSSGAAWCKHANSMHVVAKWYCMVKPD